MKNVFELQGSMRNIETDSEELVFPNIQTCVALAVNTGTQLVGAHITLANRRDVDALVAKINEKAGGNGTNCAVFALGALDNYPPVFWSKFKRISRMIYTFNTGPFLDVKIEKGPGYSCKFYSRKSSKDAFQEIAASKVRPV